MTCWGNNSSITGDVPDAAKFGPFVDVAAGRYGGCVIDSSSKLLCWGSSYLTTEPTSSVQAVVLDPNYDAQACAIDTSGGLTCWGASDSVVNDAP